MMGYYPIVENFPYSRNISNFYAKNNILISKKFRLCLLNTFDMQSEWIVNEQLCT